MSILLGFLWLCFIALAHAGGDPDFAMDPPAGADSETAADHLMRSVIAKPSVPYQQAEIQQGKAFSAEEWAKQAEQRSVELRALQHQLEVAKLNADIAASRRACRATGAENCPLTGSLMHAVTQETAHFVPKVIGISGSKAQVFDGVSLVWVLEGERIANYVVDQVLLDSVVFVSPNGRKIYQNIGISKELTSDE